MKVVFEIDVTPGFASINAPPVKDAAYESMLRIHAERELIQLAINLEIAEANLEASPF